MTRIPSILMLAAAWALPALSAASTWQVGPCGRGGLCPGSYTPLPSPTGTATPDPNAPTPTPTVVPSSTYTPVPGAFSLRVDIGAAQGHVDAHGLTWTADRAYGTGPYGYLDSGTAYRADGSVEGTDDPERYRVFRQAGTLHYRFDVEDNATYGIIFHFAEFSATEVGQRSIRFRLQGANQGVNTDIFAEAGAGHAMTRYLVKDVVSGPLDVELEGVQGQAVLSAIEIFGWQAMSAPTATVSPTPSPTPALSPTATPSPSPSPGPADPNHIQIRLLDPHGAVLLP